MPPFARRSVLSAAGMLENAGRVAWPAFAGVICALVTKRSIHLVPARRKRLFSPALAPVLNPGGMRREGGARRA